MESQKSNIKVLTSSKGFLADLCQRASPGKRGHKMARGLGRGKLRKRSGFVTELLQ